MSLTPVVPNSVKFMCIGSSDSVLRFPFGLDGVGNSCLARFAESRDDEHKNPPTIDRAMLVVALGLVDGADG